MDYCCSQIVCNIHDDDPFWSYYDYGILYSAKQIKMIDDRKSVAEKTMHDYGDISVFKDRIL